MAVERLRAYLKEKFPGALPSVLGKADGWTAERYGALAAECGLIPREPSAAQLAEAGSICSDPDNAEFLAASLLVASGCLHEFDLESDVVPPPYPGLIAELAGISGGEFAPSDLVSEPLSDDGACRVSFSCGGEPYQFETDDTRDYFDVVPLLRTINLALERTGHPGRYAERSNGQYFFALFGTPAAVAEFSRRTGITFDIRPGHDGPDTDPSPQSTPPLIPTQRNQGLIARIRRLFT
jgi:hypothetical protein